MRDCSDIRPYSGGCADDACLAEFHAALGRIHSMPTVAGIVQLDYVSMADALHQSYDSQPIKFRDDWRVMAFISDHSRQVGQCRQCVVLSSDALRRMAVQGINSVDLSAPRGSDLALGDPLFDICMVVALDFPIDLSLQSLHRLITRDAKSRDVLWFAWHHLVTSLVATVAMCDETAINRVQRRITSFASFVAAAGMRL